jgi:hypothetical protein
LAAAPATESPSLTGGREDGDEPYADGRGGRTVACIRASDAAVGCISVLPLTLRVFLMAVAVAETGAAAAAIELLEMPEPAGMIPEMLRYENAEGGGGAGRAFRITSA